LRPLIIITDATATGDDSIAISMLLAARRGQVKLIIATSGNIWAEEADANVRALLARLGCQDIGVCVGMSSAQFTAQRYPLIKSAIEKRDTAYAGAFGRPVPAAAAADVSSESLFEAIKRAGRPDLLVLAPASPLASIISRHEDFAGYVGRVFLMGGAVTGRGNTTAAAEFNFWFDAPAAEALLAADVPITLLPLEVTAGLIYPPGFQFGLNPADPTGRHVRACIAERPLRPVCDEVLAAVLLDESIITRRSNMKLAVQAAATALYGEVTVLPDSASRRAVDVIEEIDQSALWALIRAAVTVPDEKFHGSVSNVTQGLIT
jgi:inosine-uridine nucleoside N-ribohydrolase